MGCLYSKPNYTKLDPSANARYNFTPNEGVYYHNEKDAYIKSRALAAIKKGDLFLFQQMIHQHQVRPTELLGSFSDRKGVVHMLAEYNFANGMNFILEHINKVYPNEASFILNAKDSKGNTSLILCVLYESLQTLEVLLSSEWVDANIRNDQGKTALEIALEKESDCAKLLSVCMTQDQKLHNGRGLITLNMSGISTQWGSSNKKDEFESPLGYTAPESNELLKSRSENFKISPLATRLFHVIETLKDTDDGFIDEEFPHDNYSIGGDLDLCEYFNRSILLAWQRPTEFMKVKNIRLLEHVQVNDVSSSPIAGCDLYSVLAAMTEFPQRLIKVFTSREANKLGAYSVVFLVCGVPLEIVLDDYFPYIQSEGQLLFSRPKNNEIWFSLLEKAVAKLYGNYAEINGIDIIEAFELIAGMPSAKYNLKEMKTVNELWKNLVEFHQRNYFICVGNYEAQEPNKSKHLSVINVLNIDEFKMIKLRGHYNNHVFYQKFIDRNKKWSKEFKEKIGYFENETDCFYLEASELLEEFDFVSVCYYHEGWCRNRIDVRSNSKEEVFFEISISKSTEIFVSIHQKLPSFVDEGPDYKVSPVEISIAQDLGDHLKLIDSGEKNASVGNQTIYASEKIKMHLPEGKYIIRTKAQWVDGQSHEFILNTFSQLPVSCQRIDPSIYPNFLERVYMNLAIKSQDRFTFGHDCSFVSAWAGSHIWLCAINDGDKIWNLQVIFDTMENLKIAKKYRQSDNIVKFRIPPGEKSVAFVKRLTLGEVALNWHFSQTWE